MIVWRPRHVPLLLLVSGLLWAGVYCVAVACTSTTTSGPVVSKQFLGWTYRVEPVDAPWQGPPWSGDSGRSWADQAGALLGRVTWLMAVGGVVGAYALYKFPALLRRVRARKLA